MNSVLMIPYFFPPEGSAGVFRPLRFVRQLNAMGWETTVVAGHPYRYERYDFNLVNDIPKETEIIRVRGSDLWQRLQAWRSNRLQKHLSGKPIETVEQVHSNHQAPFRTALRSFMRTVESYYYIPDRTKSWICPAVNATRVVCARKRPSVLWATIGPVSAGVVALQTSQLTSIPFVLDFRDPWELYYYESERQRPHAVIRKMHRIMYRLFESARGVVFLFPRVAECYYRAYPGALDPAKIHIIPNGYEGEIEKFHVPSGNVCTILYAGTLSTYRFDTFLEALQNWKAIHPGAARELKVLFIGEGMGPLAWEANKRGVSDIVQAASAVSHDEVKKLHQNAHAFLILGRHPERKGHELVAGAKLFGYFKSRKPIIGVLPDDETKRILVSVGVETVADSGSVPEIITVLQRVHAAWSTGQLSALLPEMQGCKEFSSESQTLALTRALEGKPPIEPFVPGKANVPTSLREIIDDKSLWF